MLACINFHIYCISILNLLGKARYFSNYDLKSGYWQLAMDLVDREKNTFTCHKGLFEFNVMPFGLTNAPAVFSELMAVVLDGLESFAITSLEYRALPNKFNMSSICANGYEFIFVI
jgi:hypothetical protein